MMGSTSEVALWLSVVVLLNTWSPLTTSTWVKPGHKNVIRPDSKGCVCKGTNKQMLDANALLRS